MYILSLQCDIYITLHKLQSSIPGTSSLFWFRAVLEVPNHRTFEVTEEMNIWRFVIILLVDLMVPNFAFNIVTNDNVYFSLTKHLT